MRVPFRALAANGRHGLDLVDGVSGHCKGRSNALSVRKARPGLLKIGVFQKNTDFTGNKVPECADFKQKPKKLVERCFVCLLCYVYGHQANRASLSASNPSIHSSLLSLYQGWKSVKSVSGMTLIPTRTDGWSGK